MEMGGNGRGCKNSVGVEEFHLPCYLWLRSSVYFREISVRTEDHISKLCDALKNPHPYPTPPPPARFSKLINDS